MRSAKEDRPRVWPVYLLGLLLAPAGAIDATIQASKAKRLGFSTARYWVAFSVFAIVTLIAVISILSSIGSGTSLAPTLIPGQATADQICQSMVGQGLQNTLTGQNLNEKIVSESDAVIVSNLNASGNEVATCTFTRTQEWKCRQLLRCSLTGRLGCMAENDRKTVDASYSRKYSNRGAHPLACTTADIMN